jgi:hypothetical protein
MVRDSGREGVPRRGKRESPNVTGTSMVRIHPARPGSMSLLMHCIPRPKGRKPTKNPGSSPGSFCLSGWCASRVLLHSSHDLRVERILYPPEFRHVAGVLRDLAATIRGGLDLPDELGEPDGGLGKLFRVSPSSARWVVASWPVAIDFCQRIILWTTRSLSVLTGYCLARLSISAAASWTAPAFTDSPSVTLKPKIYAPALRPCPCVRAWNETKDEVGYEDPGASGRQGAVRRQAGGGRAFHSQTVWSTMGDEPSL